MSCGAYIPKRIYELLKCIYTEHMTVVCAPLGCGKSTTLREFVRRSRPDGCSCRFVTGCTTADECFCRITRIMFGREVHLPITEDDGVELYRLNRSRKPDKQLLIIADCEPAAEMLLGNMYCLKLFQDSEMAHIVVVSNEQSHFSRRLIERLAIREITERDLALTAEEARHFLAMCGAESADHVTMYRRSEGNIFKLRLCALMHSRGQRIRSYDAIRMIHAAFVADADRVTHLALLCACAHYGISERMCGYLRNEPAVAEYFGVQNLDREVLYGRLHEMNAHFPVMMFDEKSSRCAVHELVRRAVYRSFVLLPANVQRGLRICTANEFAAMGRSFEAFCNFALSKDYYSAAMVTQADVTLSVLPFLSANQAVFRFVLECPLDSKPILPWLLHTLVLLMFTPYKERVTFRFDEVIAYLTTAPDYTEQERRNLLAYTHAMRTYQDFYVIDKMGMHIKRAYEYFTGERVSRMPFYLWALYVPSMFALVHRYSVPLSAQSEQFVRYNRMYIEISGHGKFFDRVYLAELRYNVGDIADAKARALSIIAEATDAADAAPRMIAYTLAAECELLSGGYEEYKRLVAQIADMMRSDNNDEIYRMGSLCLALIGCLSGSGADVWRVTAVTDELILSNRYAAPFCFFVRCISMLESKEYTRLLERMDYYLEIIDAVHSETLELKVKLCAAAAYYCTEQRGRALELMDEVLGVLVDSGVIMSAVEMCMLEPQLFVLAKERLSEAYAEYIGKVMRMAKPMRRSVDDLRTQQMTATWYEVRRNEQVRSYISRVTGLDKKKLRELGLTEKALVYAVLAARRYSNEEIAQLCGTTADSVKSSLKRTYARLGIRSRAQLRYVPALREFLEDA